MWFYGNQEVNEIDIKQYKAFVYLITNLTNGKKYIGKKRLEFIRNKQIKGIKKKIKVESDWKTYTGSSDELNADIELTGIENFKKEILHFCTGLGESNYLEAKEQFLRNVLESDEYYNTWISCKIHKSHLTKFRNRLM